MVAAIVLTLAACTRIHAVCDPLYAYEAYQQAQDAYMQCLTAAGMEHEAIMLCQKPERVERPKDGQDHAQCDRLVSLCKEQSLW